MYNANVGGAFIMHSKSVFTFLRDTLLGLLYFFIPLGVVGGSAVAMRSLLLSGCPDQSLAACILIALGALVAAFSLFHASYSIYLAYGAGFGGILLLYVSVSLAYINDRLLTPDHLFWALTVIALAAGYIAVRFHGWLLAVLAIAMGVVTPSFTLAYLSYRFIAWYFVFFLSIVMVVAYYRRWRELAFVAFLGFLLYNPLLFSITDLQGDKGFLSIYQVIDFMIAIFVIYTGIPWLYSLCCSKKGIFEAMSIALGGAYTAAIIHFVIERQISFVAQLPFFIRYFVGKAAPVMNDVYMYIFVIYGSVYAVLGILLYLINRQAKATMGALVSLVVVSFVGMVYIHTKATGLLPSLVQAKNMAEKFVQRIMATASAK